MVMITKCQQSSLQLHDDSNHTDSMGLDKLATIFKNTKNSCTARKKSGVENSYTVEENDVNANLNVYVQQYIEHIG